MLTSTSVSNEIPYREVVSLTAFTYFALKRQEVVELFVQVEPCEELAQSL